MKRSVGIALIVFVSYVFCDPCNNYAILDDTKRSADYVLTDPKNDVALCDRSINQTWYKFGSQGKTMPTSCVHTYHCGTHIPLWMVGTHPSPSDGIVVRKVCGTKYDNSDCCSRSYTIKVKNCGSFFVYELKSTGGCSAAYCAGTGNACPSGQWSSSGCKAMFPSMSQTPTLSRPIVTSSTFKFDCRINFDPSKSDVGFQVKWLLDNQTDPNIPVTTLRSTERNAELDQKYLQNHLGKSLSCIANSFYLKDPFNTGPYLTSNGYWCGIKFSKSSLTVGENEPAKKVKIISTIPIVCPPSAQNSCKLDIYLENKQGDARFTQCTQTLKPTDWNPRTNEAVTEFEVLAERDSRTDKDKILAVHFHKIESFDAPDVFKNYTLPFLPIHTIDKETASCQCTNDPWCQTFDGLNFRYGRSIHAWYGLQETGEFTLYKSTLQDRLFKTEIRTSTCGMETGSCICAVAAQEGNDIVVIDMCHTHYGHAYPQVTIPNSQNQGMVVNRDQDGDVYLIDFPSGAQVHVEVYNGTSLTVTVDAPESDFGATAGLCGTFDNNPDNDLQHKNGQVDTATPYPHAFIESWRIPIGSSLFDNICNIPINPKYDNSIFYCDCKNKKHQVDCHLSKGAPPPLKTRCPTCSTTMTSTHCNAQGGIIGKRATSVKADTSPVYYTFDYGIGHQIKEKFFPTPRGITRADAEMSCKKVFDQSSTINQCKSYTGFDHDGYLEMCIEDLKYSDDKSFIKMALNSAVTSCRSVVVKNVTSYAENGKPPAFITTDFCPKDCSGHGTCRSGTCICDFGYYGDDCNIDTRDPPTLYFYASAVTDVSVLCDVTMNQCKVAFLAGSNFYNNSRLSCKLKELKFDGSAFVATGQHFSTGVTYQSRYSVGCKLPVKPSGEIIDGYNISISNDGRLYSNELNVIKIDSTCMDCDDLGASCQVMDHTCMIDGKCFQAGDTRTENQHLKCDPSKNKLNWTNTDDSSHIVYKPDTLPTAPLGGTRLKRFDIWTTTQTGCKCSHDPTQTNCACCDAGGCQCPAPNQHQCAVCGNMTTCGSPQPAPEMGLDGYTIALADCNCKFDTKQYDCACCVGQSCQCGWEHRNQCVDCKHMDQCGKKPWIFGPPMPLHH